MMINSIGLVIPIFAKAQHVYQMLQSLELQSSIPDEIILVDDRYSEETTELIKLFVRRSKLPITIVTNDSNQGVSVSTKIGIDNIVSDFIGFVDSDDFLLPHAIERFRFATKDISIDGYSSSFACITNSSDVYDHRLQVRHVREDKTNTSMSWQQKLIFDNVISHFKVLRKDLASFTTANPKWDGVQDLIINFSIPKSSSIVFDDEVTYLHRQHPNQLTLTTRMDSTSNLTMNEFRLRYLKTVFNVEYPKSVNSEIQRIIKDNLSIICEELKASCGGSVVYVDQILSRILTKFSSSGPVSGIPSIGVMKAPGEESYQWKSNHLRLLQDEETITGLLLDTSNPSSWGFVQNYSGLFDFIVIDNPLLLGVIRPHVPEQIQIIA